MCTIHIGYGRLHQGALALRGGVSEVLYNQIEELATDKQVIAVFARYGA